MKRIITQIQLGVLAVAAIAVSSCKTEKLNEVLAKETFNSVNLALDSKLEVGTGAGAGTFTVGGAEVTVPVTINFSAPTSRAFTVNLSADVDTVAKLITANTLPATTIALPAGAVGVPTTVNVPIGVKTFTFNTTINRSAIEKYYGKNVAAVVKISNPAKGNTIASGKNALIIVIKSGEVLDASTIHEISFATPPGLLNIPTPGYYDVGSENITVNIPVKMQGSLGPEFTVGAELAPDSVNKYINNGTFTKSVLYAGNKVSLTSPSIKFNANTNTAFLSFTTKVNTLLAIQPTGGVETVDMPVIAFKLTNPSQFALAKTNTTVYVRFDPNFFRPYFGTPFLIKGTIGVESSPIFAAHYDFGGEGVAYHDDNSKSGDGSYRAPDNVDVSGDATPRTVVGWTSDNEWLTYTVNIEQAGNYDMSLYLGSDNTNGRVSVYLDNVLLNATQINGINTGSYGNQKLTPAVNVKLPAGRHILKAFWNKGSHDFRGFVFKRTS